ncbi:hypothetical protein L1987_78533 [Smallanthus sonchifolius]|uniref:Uncharacterized protein n=1 Tax=Smallanthus sonchifolius TaxID=185202 RepID=A0ACB8ZDH6_9ASTR|nr:hypothetical protein L1987_78533 [Smallanthus sonchifolius]
MKSCRLNLKDRCKKPTQVHALTINSILPSSSNSDESISLQLVNAKSHLGLPDLYFIEPPIDPRLNHVDFVDSISDMFQRIMHSGSESEARCLYLEPYALLCALGDLKLLRRSLQLARAHAVDVHSKVVRSAWLGTNGEMPSLLVFPPWIVLKLSTQMV